VHTTLKNKVHLNGATNEEKIPNNRIKTDAGKLAEALRGKVIGWRGLCGAFSRPQAADGVQTGMKGAVTIRCGMKGN
jgi:hypothetical protein